MFSRLQISELNCIMRLDQLNMGYPVPQMSHVSLYLSFDSLDVFDFLGLCEIRHQLSWAPLSGSHALCNELLIYTYKIQMIHFYR